VLFVNHAFHVEIGDDFSEKLVYLSIVFLEKLKKINLFGYKICLFSKNKNACHFFVIKKFKEHGMKFLIKFFPLKEIHDEEGGNGDPIWTLLYITQMQIMIIF
jgi:hypothetical protein